MIGLHCRSAPIRYSALATRMRLLAETPEEDVARVGTAQKELAH